MTELKKNVLIDNLYKTIFESVIRMLFLHGDQPMSLSISHSILLLLVLLTNLFFLASQDLFFGKQINLYKYEILNSQLSHRDKPFDLKFCATNISPLAKNNVMWCKTVLAIRKLNRVFP